MTDYEKMKGLYDSLGIEYEASQLEDEHSKIYLPEGKGYCGFYCEFYFNKEGRFLEYGVWE